MVATLAGVAAVLDMEDDRVVDQVGLPTSEILEIALHFAGTWGELLSPAPHADPAAFPDGPAGAPKGSRRDQGAIRS